MPNPKPRSEIVITLLPFNRVCVRATCEGAADAQYTPMADTSAPAELQKLIAELRAREAGVTK